MQKRQVRKFVELATITSALSISLTGYAVAAVDMFIKIDGVKGESQDAKHKDEIDILAWSWGATNSGSTQSGGGGGSGKANIQDISITKYVDKASPLLLGKVCQGEHIKEATLTVRKEGKTPLEYIKITLSDILVSSISTGGSGGSDRLTENISLNFAKFKYEYTPQKADGSAEGSVPFGYNIKEGKAASLSPELSDGQERVTDNGSMTVAQLVSDFIGQDSNGKAGTPASVKLQIKLDPTR